MKVNIKTPEELENYRIQELTKKINGGSLVSTTPFFTNGSYNYTTASGKMFQVYYKINSMDFVQSGAINNEKIKLELCKQLVDTLYKSDYISFTRMYDSISQDITFNARIFVTPNDQTFILAKTYA